MKSPDLVKMELARLRTRQRKANESRYVDAQRVKLPPIAFVIALLAFSLGLAYKLTPNISTEIVKSIDDSKTGFYKLKLSSHHLTVKYNDVLPIHRGAEVKVYSSLTGDVHHIDTGSAEFRPHLSFYQYSGFAILTGILLVYSGLAARFNWKLWFQFWIFGLIGAFSTALCFFVTR